MYITVDHSFRRGSHGVTALLPTVIAGTPPLNKMSDLKVVTMNVNGLNSPCKRRAIFDHLRKAKADVYLLQETHSSPDTEKIWAQEWGAHASFCNGSRSSKGVAILLARDLAFTLHASRSDGMGRLLCLDIELNEVIYTIASVYAPTQDKGQEQLTFLDADS